MFLPGRRIVLLDGIIKKQDRIPRQDLERVKAYQADMLRRGVRAQSLGRDHGHHAQD